MVQSVEIRIVEGRSSQDKQVGGLFRSFSFENGNRDETNTPVIITDSTLRREVTEKVFGL